MIENLITELRAKSNIYFQVDWGFNQEILHHKSQISFIDVELLFFSFLLIQDTHRNVSRNDTFGFSEFPRSLWTGIDLIQLIV